MNKIASTIIAAAVLVALSTTQSEVASAQNAATNSATASCAPQTDQEKRAQKFEDDFAVMEKMNFASAWVRPIDAMLSNDTWSRKCAPEPVQSSARVGSESQGSQSAASFRATR